MSIAQGLSERNSEMKSLFRIRGQKTGTREKDERMEAVYGQGPRGLRKSRWES